MLARGCTVRKPRATCPTPGQSTYRCNLPYSRAVHVQNGFHFFDYRSHSRVGNKAESPTG